MREVFRTRNIQCTHTADLGDWQLIMLNSQVQGDVYGEISTADLNWLRLWLNATTKPTLVGVHHHTMPIDSTWMDRIILKNHDELMDLLSAYDHVKAIAFGHIHQTFDSMHHHIRVLGTPSTCHQFKPHAIEFELDNLPAGYRWLELNSDGSLETGIERLPK